MELAYSLAWQTCPPLSYQVYYLR